MTGKPETVSLQWMKDHWVGRFSAMASPCELLLESVNQNQAEELLTIAHDEAIRIEQKFSRYRSDSVISSINNSNGKPVSIDHETWHLLDYARECRELSEGMFDITSGVLRRCWRFDGSDHIPSGSEIADLLPLIGWKKVTLTQYTITLLPGMEIDLGGIGKEYAVDRVAGLIRNRFKGSFVVNFGGDLYISSVRENGSLWNIGVDHPLHTGERQSGFIEIETGGIATSGDARRFLLKDGIRYSHILNPRTGYPVEQAAHSITVVAPTCMEAGMLATMAMLSGNEASAFLEMQGVTYWLQ